MKDAKFKVGQEVKLSDQRLRECKIAKVFPKKIKGKIMYQVEYRVFDEVEPEGSKVHSQPRFEYEIEAVEEQTNV